MYFSYLLNWFCSLVSLVLLMFLILMIEVFLNLGDGLLSGFVICIELLLNFLLLDFDEFFVWFIFIIFFMFIKMELIFFIIFGKLFESIFFDMYNLIMFFVLYVVFLIFVFKYVIDLVCLGEELFSNDSKKLSFLWKDLICFLLWKIWILLWEFSICFSVWVSESSVV